MDSPKPPIDGPLIHCTVVGEVRETLRQRTLVGPKKCFDETRILGLSDFDRLKTLHS